MFGPTLVVAGAGVRNAGRPRLPIRLMVALLYLKHAYNESDEAVVVRWSQDVYFQFFSGQVYVEPRLPCDPAQIGRFRRLLGEAGVEQLLKTTIEAALSMGAVKKAEFERVIVDTTVQEKGIRPAKSSCGGEVAQGCSCPRHFIADTWTLQGSSCRAGGHDGGMRRSSESRLCRRFGNPACRSRPLHWPTA